MSAANQRDEWATTHMHESRGNTEEVHEGIVSGPRCNRGRLEYEDKDKDKGKGEGKDEDGSED